MPCTMVAHLYGDRASMLLHAVCRLSTFDETLMAFVLAPRIFVSATACIMCLSTPDRDGLRTLMTLYSQRRAGRLA